MEATDFLYLIHPTLAVVVVFPLIGIVVSLSWQTRQRRLQTAEKKKSKIPAVVGPEHLKVGRWLTTSVFGVTLVALGYVLISKMLAQGVWESDRFRMIFVLLMLALTPLSYVCLYRAKLKLWRGVFATLTGMGIIILGSQKEVFRRGYEWYVSHYYAGVIATLLMIFSLAIVQDIYKDRQHRWRRAHMVLNIIATLLFALQGFTGTRDIFEIALYKTPPGFILPWVF